ncbi:MAG TPA: hypothetical protein DD426_06250 [Clostridiaceae bacterium]|nr:hypothetical protein [Clostridiaceae bacterium]
MGAGDELRYLLKYLQGEKKSNEHLIARTMKTLNKGYIKNKGLIEFNRVFNFEGGLNTKTYFDK